MDDHDGTRTIPSFSFATYYLKYVLRWRKSRTSWRSQSEMQQLKTGGCSWQGGKPLFVASSRCAYDEQSN